jgi:hypothetical protein
VRFDTKLAIVVRDDLQTWQKLNVTAFLAGAVAAGGDEVIGEPYEDACGGRYLAMFVQPVLVFVGSAEQLTIACGRAVAHGVRLDIFTEELSGADNDADNRAAVAAVPADSLRLVGLALHDRRRLVDKILRGLPWTSHRRCWRGRVIEPPRPR